MNKEESKVKGWFRLSFYESLAIGALTGIILLMLQLIENSAITRQMAMNNSELLHRIDKEHSKRLDDFGDTVDKRFDDFGAIIRKFYDDFYRKSQYKLTLPDPYTDPPDNNLFIPLNVWAAKNESGDRRGLRLGEVFRHD